MYVFLKDALITKYGEEWYEQLCYAAREIAQLLGEKPATVSTQLNRGRQQLRTLLESEGMT